MVLTNETNGATTDRSVATFFHEAVDVKPLTVKKEIDLKDYEVLVRCYKFLSQNKRRRKSKRRSMLARHPSQRRDSRSSFHLIEESSESSLSSSSSSSDPLVLSDSQRRALLTLVEVDEATKRVVHILPEFFPSNIKVLPDCLCHLGALQSLSLDHCRELTCLPFGFGLLLGLEELRIDVTSFEEPLPFSLGNLRNLKTLVVKGNCSGLNGPDDGDDAIESMLLFPSSMAKLTILRHLETHSRTILQIPATAIDAWSSSLETLVTTQDLSLSNHGSGASPNDNDEEKDGGVSRIHDRDGFRRALESQVAVRAFRLIARLRNLRSLKLLFDDSKYRTGCFSNRNQHHHGQSSNTSGVFYSVPLSLLSGPLSLSLRELDIGTCVASSTTSCSQRKSEIPIEIAWIDVLKEFPNLRRLRMQDCRCSFSNEPVAVMSELRHLVLDRCPDFAIVENTNTTLSHCTDNDGASKQDDAAVSVDRSEGNEQERSESIDRGSRKLLDFGTRFLRRCPKLEIVSIRDCKISKFCCQDLFGSLPKESLRELTLDICNNAVDDNDVWSFVRAYPSLIRMEGTCLGNLSNSKRENLKRLLFQRQQGSSGSEEKRSKSPLSSWNIFGNSKRRLKSDEENSQLVSNCGVWTLRDKRRQSLFLNQMEIKF